MTTDELKASQEMADLGQLLRQSKKAHLCDLLEVAYKAALPHLRGGVHISPIHHTVNVVQNLVRILLCENGVSEISFRDGIVAAMFHDTGNDHEPKEEPKWKVQSAGQNSSNRRLAANQRRRHAVRSASLVKAFLNNGPFRFGSARVERIVSLVRHHDDPSVAELVGGKNCRRYLFGFGKQHLLTAIHREADRLWMLTVDGIVADLLREIEGHGPWNPHAQITHNVIRHWQERLLYENAFRSQIHRFGFDAESAFYRTIGGKHLFREYLAKARAIHSRDWTRLVEEAGL